MKVKKLNQAFIDEGIPIDLHGTRDIDPWVRQFDEVGGPTNKQIVLDLASRDGFDYVCSRCGSKVAKHGIGKHPDVCKHADKPPAASSHAMKRAYATAQAVKNKKKKRVQEATGPKTKKQRVSPAQKAAVVAKAAEETPLGRGKRRKTALSGKDQGGKA